MDDDALPIKTKKFIIAAVPDCNDRSEDRDSTRSTAGQAVHNYPVGKTPGSLFDNSPEPLPARPELLCSKCDFQNGDPERLAEHLITVHEQTTAAAWFEAGQENERLYPRLRARAGEFTVLGVDPERSRGNTIGSCSSLNEAIALADQRKAAYPEIVVSDEYGRERYKLGGGAQTLTPSRAVTNTVSSEPQVNHHQKLQSTTVQGQSDEEVVDSFLLKGKQDNPPKFVVIAGPVATGKTTLRRKKYAQNYVLVDSGELFDIFIANKSGEDAEKMKQRSVTIGAELVSRSIAQRRNIVIEILGDLEEPKKTILPKMTSLGYEIEIEFIECDLKEALRREEARGRDNMSAYYSQSDTLLYFTTAFSHI